MSVRSQPKTGEIRREGNLIGGFVIGDGGSPWLLSAMGCDGGWPSVQIHDEERERPTKIEGVFAGGQRIEIGEREPQREEGKGSPWSSPAR